MTTPEAPPERQCRRGQHCAGRRPVFDEAGERSGWTAEQLDQLDGLCAACTRNLRRDLPGFPMLVARLRVLHLPTLAIVWRDLDISGSGALHPPIPLDEYVDALIRLIDHELRQACRIVVDRLGYPWDSTLETRSRVEARVDRSVTVLGRCLDTWLQVGPMEYRARSLAAEPAFGHGAAPLEYKNGDVYVTRDGLDSACLVLELHRRAREVLGDQAAQRSPLPCRNPKCKAPTVFREATSTDWRCRTCGDMRTATSHLDDLTGWRATREERRRKFLAEADAVAAAGVVVDAPGQDDRAAS